MGLHHTSDCCLMISHLPSNSFLSIHNSSFLGYHPNNAQGTSGALNTNISFSQLASSNPNTRGHSAQTLRHTFRHFTFTNKCVGAGRKCGLLTGVQMADEYNDQSRRASSSEFLQSRGW